LTHKRCAGRLLSNSQRLRGSLAERLCVIPEKLRGRGAGSG
jgi:hypothetical protein